MPQIDFYLSNEEQIKIIELIFDNGGFLVPEQNYDSTEYQTINNIHDYLSSESSLFFILHKSYMKYPFRFDYFEKENKKKYYIMQRYGGPYIDFFISGLIDGSFISCGNIGHYPYFYNEENLSFYPPIELLEFYKTITKHIKSITLPYKMQKRKYLIGKKLIQQVIANEIKLIDIKKEDLIFQCL